MQRRWGLHRRLAVGTMVALATVAPAGVAQAAPTADATCDSLVPFARENFSDPTRIDNEYLPFVPGTRLTYEGRANRGGGALPHEVVFTITDLTKVVDGVTTRVVHDVDVNEGEVAEEELAFFAQDDAGNVWNLGEYPEEYEDGAFVGAPDVWISGIDGAIGGIHMPADPEALLNGPEYLQGEAPAIDFLDCARVVGTNGTVDVPAGHFRNVLTTHERSPLESDTAIQVKDHAPGVGIVRVGAINDPEDETLVLTRVEQLGPADRAAVDAQAIRLDVHGHEVSDVYRQTPYVRVATGGLVQRNG